MRAPRRLVLYLSWLLLVVAPIPVVAQDAAGQADADAADERVEPTERQAELNEQAVRALAAGDAVRAVSLLEEANYIGELNVTYLNLGRAYQKLGDCERARQALDRVGEVPAVASPPPGLVDKKASEYLAELDAQCPEADAAPVAAAPDEPVADAPAQPTNGARLDAEAAMAADDDDDLLAWTAIGAGATFVAAGVGLQLWARSIHGEVEDAARNDAGQITGMSQAEAADKVDEAELVNAAGLSAMAVGLAATAIGGYLLWSDGDGSEAAVAVGSTGDGVSVGFKRDF